MSRVSVVQSEITQRYVDQMVAVSEVRGTASKFSSSDRTWTTRADPAGHGQIFRLSVNAPWVNQL